MVDGKVDENNWWDCDIEGRGKGDFDEEEDELLSELVLLFRSIKGFDILTVGV